MSAVVQAGLFGGLGLVAVLTAYVASRRRAVAAAEPDDGTAAVLLRLSKRNQALLHRQLGVLDELEQREADATDLAALFRADHLATQLRRNVEKAIILSGEQPGRRWRRPVPVVDVARAAAASVERHAAVMVASVDPASLVGPAVGDVTHLLTELIDNATRFAPGEATVWVTGELGLTAYTIVVQDRGPGMPVDELASARDVLARPYRPGDATMTGLRMAGRLARAHDIAIDLDEAPRGGIVVRVRVPLALLVVDTDQPAEPPEPRGLPDSTGLPDPRSGGLPVRAPRPVPAGAAGFVRRRGAGGPDRQPVDRTARFRDRLAARAPGPPGDPGPNAAARTVELPVHSDTPPQHSTVDEAALPKEERP
ncbi:sensor histidine kinase [Dactylosporangium sp. NBC_01737]|uniref:ATP-binding protein n=1 Tax=Dactylosporangium sp. NBC_01737 TaxID=2975959 RepID=UPI002E0D153A|nr:sensor histidine kinase [Dactylosporangium sp. NBC_01737]